MYRKIYVYKFNKNISGMKLTEDKNKNITLYADFLPLEFDQENLKKPLQLIFSPFIDVKR